MNNDRQFATTQWSLVLEAGRNDDTASRCALEELCRRYWYPLYAYVRRRGQNAVDAQDATQAFLLFLLEKGSLRSADGQRGRFRNFLLASLNNFLTNEHRAASAARRGGDVNICPIDVGDAEDRFANEPSHDLTPERIYERRWAMTVLDAALESVKADYQSRGNHELFDALMPMLVAGGSAPPYRQLAEQLAMTAGAIKVAVHRLRRSYGEALRCIVGETIASPDDVDDELNELMNALAG